MRWIFNRPLKSTIMRLFIPMILVFVPITGTVSYILASQQLKFNAETSLNDTLSQTRDFMNDRLTAVLAEMAVLDGSTELRSLFYRANRSDFSMTPQDYLTVGRNIDKVYANLYSIIDSILVYYRNGAISMYRRDSLHTDFSYDMSPYPGYSGGNTAQMRWLIPASNRLENDGGNTASLYKWIAGGDGKPDGMLLLQLKEQFFLEMLSTPKISASGYMLLASPDGTVSAKAASAGDARVDDEALRSMLMAQTEASGKLEMTSRTGMRIVVLYETIAINNWRLAVVYPQAEIYEKVNYIKYVNLLVTAVVVIAVALLARVLAKLIARPVTRLTRQVNSIEEGHLDVQFIESDNYEIGILSKGIKDMMERIKHLLSQVEYEQEQKRISEFAALQAQIHPHFLYNTLYSIKQLCELGETAEASRMISALSHYFRISISRGDEMIPVETELEHIRQYLTIQQMRYGNSIRYEMDVAPEMLSVPIVKLTLQPLVENAIYHGIKKVRRPGFIHISGRMEGELCRIRIEDNGFGMDQRQLDRLNLALAAGEEPQEEPPVGFGVRNVHRRLQLHYGSSNGLAYDSAEGKGTTVTVTFPLSAGKE
ncbi:sensor histidine kinase [Paenibacillus jilunlii]|uniref:histidine kinase n=2 Tax=Paenibacillus jilunlii TaxID=682956 RepID=A0A1G9NHM0_9BACL|nr:sensor histidine kinase [Paenibacillus jilunlii]SDL85527.1 two-component system, sensor histidine kinase YesM [Paenibacillus jilunlii]